MSHAAGNQRRGRETAPYLDVLPIRKGVHVSQTETVAFRMRVHAGQEDEYRRRHDAIWPELATLLRESGVVEYRIFLDPESRALFAVLTRRSDHTLDALPQHPIMQRWWAMMADIMDTNADQSPAQVSLPEMFRL